MIIIKILMLNIMTAIKKDVSDLSVDCDGAILIIKYPDVNYSYWKMLKPYSNDDELTRIITRIGEDLDIAREWDGKRLWGTNHMMYNYDVSLYYYYLLHIEDQELYNFYFDCLITRHRDNVQFELDNPILEEAIIEKSKAVAKKTLPNKFIRQVTTDMFTNEEIYIYSNSKTGETITSTDPNKLDELNSKPKKEKKVKQSKVVSVPMEAMKFSFKKKQND